jgi:hypothetical protein
MPYPVMLCLRDEQGNEDRLFAASFGPSCEEVLQCDTDPLDGDEFMIRGN